MTISCPCGSGGQLENCCLPIIEARGALTAEQLMRSRYTAFVIRDAAYLLATWHPSTRPRQIDLDDRQRWLGLRIKRTTDGLERDSEGIVEFVARYKIAGRGHRIHEISRFARIEDQWFYLDGDLLT